jgi:hypothetical protein
MGKPNGCSTHLWVPLNLVCEPNGTNLFGFRFLEDLVDVL